MPEHATPEQIALLIDGRLQAADQPGVGAHIHSCADCHAEFLLGLEVRDRRLAGVLPTDGMSGMRASLGAVMKAASRERGSGPGALLAGLTGLITGTRLPSPTPALATDGQQSVEAAQVPVSSEAHRTSEPVMDTNPTIATTYAGASPAPITRPDPVIGPGTNLSPDPGPQGFPETCAIRCQEYVLERWTGVDLPQDVYRNEAIEHGWYTPGEGTAPADVGNLLELHGISVVRYEHATIFNLTGELAQGHQVIIGVNAQRLWQENSILRDLLHKLNLAPANHAVVVSGIDTSDPDNVQVIISDPGTGEPAAHYPIEQFIAAWESSDFFMVSTTEPPPENMRLPEMAHFDYEAGHIPSIGVLDYDAFLKLAADPTWPSEDREAELLLRLATPAGDTRDRPAEYDNREEISPKPAGVADELHSHNPLHAMEIDSHDDHTTDIPDDDETTGEDV